eukprot:CAMPEP_0197450940 /NCGR_PEP_ID=MMETSP1175-20131217/27130_1 /TAXON_ID=1003142 /ORGANISM="Triceratium dubium, Strain CCMP147" /LENGTH=188 /DNA_ID=CAMNT_0042983503 /DNA_START=96 /DNA_END=658 /DNA_ORIENTATION=-
MPSIALGALGPPTLSKILFEAHILKLHFGEGPSLQKLADCDPANVSHQLSAQLSSASKWKHTDELGSPPSLPSIVSVASTIGVPVLLEDNWMVRGPNITEPEPTGHDSRIAIDRQEDIDLYAERGWVDLRSQNLLVWKKRAQRILAEIPTSAEDTTSLTGLHYGGKSNELDPAALATWIIAGELHGHR